ncbi:hypothetical protein ETU08_09630 [Apibacter muscae]|uniref:Uncharacterized protein n=1 Tax=Apibacter muscae TaxID=2509004 RepID=A0A563D7T0_9FLAO|nr:hypothetical protein [Apibacter muscae]TWP26129.1 hypothetical protein ETU09_10520 [Apibacter muscae]TWP27971.1 hypothetical protein ETU08_09630 [Apibacter muscae]
MKNIYYRFALFLFIVQCSPYKKAESQLNKGDYAQAFETSINVYTKNYSQDKKEKQLILLQNAYLNANKKEEEELKILKSNLIPDYKRIYLVTKSLSNRYAKISPLLPLYNNGKELKFPTKDLQQALALAKENYLNSYYNKGVSLLERNNKASARDAYEYFQEIKEVDANYRDISFKLKEAYNQGLNIILVGVKNNSGTYLPSDLPQTLLFNINNYNKNFWTLFTLDFNEPHDEEVVVNINGAFVNYGNERIFTHNYEKDIIDGWEYLKDSRGFNIKDADGNYIKVDRYVKLQAQVTEVIKQRDAVINATFQLYNSFTGNLINTYPVTSRSEFKSAYGILNGNREALDIYALELINAPRVPYPNDRQMLTDCGIDLRNQLINFLNSL